MSDKSRLSFVLLLSLAALFFFARDAHACSCMGTPTVLGAYEGAAFVVVVRAVSVEKSEKAAPEGGLGDRERYVDGVKSTTMRVERVFKGGLKVGDEMTFAQGGGADCIWTFAEKDVGKNFLFYLNRMKDSAVWYAGTCGRSNRVDYAGDDLLYLEKLGKVRGKTRLSGTLSFEGDGPGVGGRVIRVVGEKQTYEAKTDAGGVYEIYDLPPGEYKVELEVPEGWKVNYFPVSLASLPTAAEARKESPPRSPVRIPVVIQDKSHSALDINFEIDNVIRGKVLDAGGRPLRGVCVRALRARADENSGYHVDCTKDDGAFAIDELPPGNYILVANDGGKVSSSEPFQTLYYPNVFEREKAGVINVGAGDRLEDFNIFVPKLEETVTVEGVVLYSDGKAVVGERVEFRAGKTEGNVEGNAQATTDTKGRFRIKILKGLQGELYGELYAYLGKYEDCPQLDALVKKTGLRVPEIRTPALKIQADADLFNVELKYPFPSCKKEK